MLCLPEKAALAGVRVLPVISTSEKTHRASENQARREPESRGTSLEHPNFCPPRPALKELSSSGAMQEWPAHTLSKCEKS